MGTVRGVVCADQSGQQPIDRHAVASIVHEAMLAQGAPRHLVVQPVACVMHIPGHALRLNAALPRSAQTVRPHARLRRVIGTRASRGSRCGVLLMIQRHDTPKKTSKIGVVGARIRHARFKRNPFP
ncbi:hypothetical protein BBSC_2055 [Bifidobacterium scardovii JCM 12489 = DSM 13734]|nr:hypothetical protein BBSC_2055 [Bifidobacterium scardovii JCM 12489 = DSM 13734]